MREIQKTPIFKQRSLSHQPASEEQRLELSSNKPHASNLKHSRKFRSKISKSRSHAPQKLRIKIC